ncbi:N-acetylmuramoyl-L-alanine amidase [Paracoccus caeni]|uniref:N-acetylmuramoyl-L-alanine amidase n=1 Tax=Paracoccus caeni TaxID=657651 RepID=A0A934SEG4_9RHOB|nr:N-acetylmuramoyl-L-alanine amidase [Paracoccus caeni]MBK4215875.1 N-acetylmuramoyl-L-alanine amidase [Paracoccus caeni]
MRLLALLLAVLMMLSPAAAQDRARLDLGASALVESGRAWWGDPPLELRLALTKAVPWRVNIVSDPVRLVLDIRDVDLNGADAKALFGAGLATDVRWGRYRDGWSRVVVELPGPYRIASAVQKTTPPLPQITVTLEPVAEADFTAPPSATAALRGLPDPAEVEALPPREGLVVVLDPGHGGFDPGALAEGETEANLVLVFALELRKALQDRGVQVVLTRESDTFVPLEERMTLAREARGDLFISLHADALPTGQAAGATVYVWNPRSDGQAAQHLVNRHERSDLISGVDFGGQDDALAAAMMDFARTDTQPRSENFARWLSQRMALMGIGQHGRPVQGAAFSVLKSPDIPSVLLELGFISDYNDRANLLNPEWRDRMVMVMSEAVLGWARDEGQRASMLRK